jgi:inner membrane protein
MNFFDRLNEWLRNSLIVKLIAIGILILLLLIPANMVESLIREREYNSERVINEVSDAWSYPQQLIGPLLSVPYRVYFTDEEGKTRTRTRTAHFLPSNLAIDGELDPQTRYRSIYEVVVYNTQLQVSGRFERPNFEDFKIDSSDVLWDEAILEVGISDMRGIQNIVQLNWNSTSYAFSPGIQYPLSNANSGNYTMRQPTVSRYDYAEVEAAAPTSSNSNASGMSVKLDLTPAKATYDFSFQLDLNGSRSIYFTPLGETTTTKLTSTWSTPSFRGAFLPDERDVTESGFEANWEVLSLNRNYPQQWLDSQYSFNGSRFGVELLIPADHYQKSMRSAKYSILFIALTFLIFFFVEALNGKRIHPIQYILVGLALILFYTLLLAMSEYIGFTAAYWVATALIIGLVALYIRSIFKNDRLTLVTTAILVILYGFIFTLLQLEDYALLLGSIGLFIILGFVMLFTRKIDWYQLNRKE